LRWLRDIWQSAKAARQEGVDVRAVTVWALLGTFDWNSLVTDCRGYYEPGPFDVRGPTPRPTALAGLVRELAADREPSHPVLRGEGWWRRPGRFFCPPVPQKTVTMPRVWQRRRHTAEPAAPILVSGATGTLGRAFARLCEARGLDCLVLDRAALDIADPGSVTRALATHRPWAVVNASGYVRIDDAESDVARCMRENAAGPALLAAHCAAAGIALLTFSSDQVFDGSSRDGPWLESDPTAPLNVYGRSKARAEAAVLAAHPAALVVRTSAFFGPWDRHNVLHAALATLAAGDTVAALEDGLVSPTYVPDLVAACLDLLVDRECGIWHLANQGAVSWADLVRRTATLAGFDPSRVVATTAVELGYRAARPRNAALDSERGRLLPTLDDALARYVIDRAAAARELVPATETAADVALVVAGDDREERSRVGT
jgi:dTDP-4-dehydrorhamnose reductase